MSMTLTSKQEETIDRLVKAGLFASKEDALDCGLTILGEEADRLEALRADIKEGLDQAERGEFSALSADDIKNRIKKRLETETIPRA